MDRTTDTETQTHMGTHTHTRARDRTRSHPIEFQYPLEIGCVMYDACVCALCIIPLFLQLTKKL